jgi:hypothetical protein
MEPINELARQELDDIKRIGKQTPGYRQLIAHLTGKELSAKDAIKAQCYLCMGYYSDGRGIDCEERTCPLYPYNPHGSEPAKRTLTEKQKAVLKKMQERNLDHKRDGSRTARPGGTKG